MEVISDWAQTDPMAAGQWLQRLAAGQERDTAVSEFAYYVVDRDPAAAFDWVKTVGDPFFRDVQFNALASRWIQSDPDAATKWIQASDNSPPISKRSCLLRGSPAARQPWLFIG